MKLWKISSCLTLAVLAPCLLFSGCGGGSSGATVTTVSISSSVVGNVLILGQSTTLNASVVGPANTNVTWQPCMYTTTPAATTANPNPVASSQIACPSDGSLGTLSNTQPTGTATFTAPSVLPDPTKFPGLTIVINVQAVADSS